MVLASHYSESRIHGGVYEIQREQGTCLCKTIEFSKSTVLVQATVWSSVRTSLFADGLMVTDLMSKESIEMTGVGVGALCRILEPPGNEFSS